MVMQCPHCRSIHIESLDRAKKAGGAIGFVGGAASGAAGAMSGARVGATVGMLAGPVGASIGGLTGALLGGLMGGAAGSLAGSRIGQLLDERVLDNYHCLKCDQVFSAEAAQEHAPKPIPSRTD